ncbi:PRTRC system ParB family protein [Aliidiomarina quisquiliarum]|uniref:PRTRC system ParB family protein n=1 Tax=Aliidiomarina quisquiliarum TaxID=2938947 RepID=UPI00208F7BE1|nr:PRTRC system ParB family protein [Aliidiomarina quisquiliarum]MCO4319985.1 PRTRC system ParB family protein [Aliidiomarina quisquiliarum]
MQQAQVKASENSDLIHLHASDIIAPPFANARRKRDPQSYEELKNSVSQNGFVSAITVRPAPENGKYELIAGFGRKQVAEELGIPLPCIVRQVSDEQAYALHISENLDRENLSFIDEVYAAKTFTSFYAGDRDSAAKRLGWSRKKLYERLELLACDEKVLSALEAGTIKAGHALILAPFEQSVQVSTLEKVITENLSVKDLRERARRVQLPLANAKFNTASCNGCPFNSQQQSGLFDSPDDGALCSKPKCYIEKTQAHLADVVAEQEESHSRVIFMTSSVNHDRITVSAANVGKEQFESGCMGCDSRAALVDDRPGYEGQVTPSQCLNKSCFDECVTLLENETKSPEIEPISPSEVSDDSSDSQADNLKVSATTSTTKVQQKTPDRVIDHHKNEIRAFAAQHVSENQSVRLAIMALSVEALFGLSNISTTSNPTARIKELLALDDKGIKEAISHALDNGIQSATTVKGNTPMYDFMAQVLSCVAGGNEAAVEQWKPTKEALGNYYTQGIQSIVKSSGVETSLPKGVMPTKKGELISAILAAEFDWSGFAPAPFKKLLK